MHHYAFEEDERSGDILFWADTSASLKRILTALAISAIFGVALGLSMGVIPYVRVTLTPFIAAVSLIPPLALLPILFIVAGLGELAKVLLIIIGVAPIMVRDLALRVAEFPAEQIIKAQTLGASTWQLILRIVMPQLWPRLIDALRLSLGSAWLFLIASEAIASTEGSAIVSFSCAAISRWMSSYPMLPGSRCWRSRWTPRCVWCVPRHLPGPNRADIR